MNTIKLAIPLFVALAYGPAPALAVPILGAALKSFAVLGAAGVTNVAPSTIGGNLGSAPNASVGGGYVFTSGSLQPNTGLAQQAQLDLDAAILAVNAGTATFLVPLGDLIAYQAANGGTIIPGTYDVGAATENIPGVGTLILDGNGDGNTAVWRFRFSTTLITSTTSNVTVQNIGDGANVGIYWSVGTAATLDGPTFAGNVLAHDLISSDGNLTITCGRLLSAETQVTLIQDNISIGCADTTVGSDVGNSGGFDQGLEAGPSAVPEPATLLLFGLGLAGLLASRKRLLPVA